MSSTSGICWPARFFLKSIIVFFSALIVGIVLALVTHKTTTPDTVKAYVKVTLHFNNGSTLATAADISRVEKTGAKWDTGSVFKTDANATTGKSWIAGKQYYFLVWPVNEKQQHEGSPVDWSPIWPDKAESTLQFDIQRPYAAPGHWNN